jgi:hypothetical protein
MKNKTVLMAAVLAVATVLAVELTVLPSSVQEVQANPCSIQANGPGGISGGQNSDGGEREADLDTDCDFEGVGSLEFEEESEEE